MKTASFDLPKVNIDEEQVADLISGAMSDTCGFDWWKENPREYEQAKEQLVKESEDPDEICYENVLARVLFNGGAVEVLESESDWHWKGHEDGEMLWNWQIQAEGTEPEGGTWHKITLSKLCDGIAKYMSDKGYSSVNKILEEGDFWDFDAIFQYAAYGEIVFG